jgi:hypothetical protein
MGAMDCATSLIQRPKCTPSFRQYLPSLQTSDMQVRLVIGEYWGKFLANVVKRTVEAINVVVNNRLEK